MCRTKKSLLNRKLSDRYLLDVESQLMPSLWCKRMDPSIVVDEHVRITTEESNRVAETIPSEMQITYKEGSPSATLDIFGTDLPNESPIFVYISGGYWQELSGDISAYPVMPLYQNGIVSVIPNYGRAPKGNLPLILHSILIFLLIPLKCVSFLIPRGVFQTV